MFFLGFHINSNGLGFYRDKIKECRDDAHMELVHYGQSKARTFEGAIGVFINAFEKIKNVEPSSSTTFDVDGYGSNQQAVLHELRHGQQVVAATNLGLGSGAVSYAALALGAYNGSMLLAENSAGKVIPNLNRVAAENATLAWLADGSTSGGRSTVVAGAISIATPTILGLDNIHCEQDQGSFEGAEIVCEKLTAIGSMAKELNGLLSQAARKLRRASRELESVVENKGDDYSAYDKEDRVIVATALSYARLIKLLIDMPVLDEAGNLLSSAQEKSEIIARHLQTGVALTSAEMDTLLGGSKAANNDEMKEAESVPASGNSTIKILESQLKLQGVNRQDTVLVVATMSAGKSTLINAILGQELLPAANEATTACVTVLQENSQEQAYRAACFDGAGSLIAETQQVDVAQLRQWNSDINARLVHISGKLRQGDAMKGWKTVLVDTPGPNNSQDESHRDGFQAALQEVPCDRLVYVLNVSQLGINDCRETLEGMKVALKANPSLKVAFVLNKMDLLDPCLGETEEEAHECALKYIENSGFENPLLFKVSAKNALLARKLMNDGWMSRRERADAQQQLERFADAVTVIEKARMLEVASGVPALERWLAQR